MGDKDGIVENTRYNGRVHNGTWMYRKGWCVGHSQDAKKETKKKPQKTLKEKRLAKKMKKAGGTS